MNKNKILMTFLLVTLVFLPFLTLLSFNTVASSTTYTYASLLEERTARLGLGVKDLSHEALGAKEIAIRNQAAENGVESLIDPSIQGQEAVPGETITITVSDDGLGIDYPETFRIVLEGSHGIILVENSSIEDIDDDGFDDDGIFHFPNPNGNATLYDSIDFPWLRLIDNITLADLTYLLDEFDNNIWETVTTVFGEPLPRGDEGQKVWVLIHNIRDDLYWGADVESYIAGYFSSSEDFENQKNMMHIDSYDWERRTGPDASRPFLYEGVFAHEFEHLVHFDQDPDEPSWVDEGCAELAMFLCGYGHPDRHIDEYFFWHAITSLTFWGGNLEDYGIAYLWTLYLYEQFGSDFISAMVQEQANGIEGVENTLKTVCRWLTFDRVYDWWTIAIYMDDEERYFGRYGFENLDIGTEDTYFGSIELYMEYFDYLGISAIYETPFTVESTWFLDIEPQPYTPHFHRFTNEKLARLTINGADWSGVNPFSGSYEWYSDAGAWAWRNFYQTFDIPDSGATLNFKTYFEIEWNWDYGYVEVYNGTHWFTLYDPLVVMYDDYFDPYGMLNFVGHPQANPNTPVGRAPTDYETAGQWYAFSGYSDGWIDVSMDLDLFAGQTIDIYFTLWQDGAFTLQNMYVDDISIPEIGFSDDVENDEGGWMIPEDAAGWIVTDGHFDNNFGVTLLKNKWADNDVFMKLKSVKYMCIRDSDETGSMYIATTKAAKDKFNVAIVSNKAQHILTAHYSLSTELKKWNWHWWHHWWHYRC